MTEPIIIIYLASTVFAAVFYALQEICNTYGLEEKSRRMKITRNLSKHDGYLVFRLLPQTGERNLFYNAEE